MIEISTNAGRLTTVAAIDIPATEAGFAAAEDALFAGINVNLTFVCSPRQFGAARATHRRALARRLEAHLTIQRIACVARTDASAGHRAAFDGQSAGAAPAAHAVLAQLARHGIDLDTIGNDLLRAGLTQCRHADAQLLALPA